MVFDQSGAIVAMDQKEHRQIFPQPGWVEHDPQEIWANVQAVVKGALAKLAITAPDLAAVGITNQRETTVLWDRRTGRSVHNALVWQDTRVDAMVAEFARDGGQDRFRDRTGLPLASLEVSKAMTHPEGLPCPSPPPKATTTACWPVGLVTNARPARCICK